MALFLVFVLGISGLSANRIGGDGIATGIVSDVAPSCILIGVGMIFVAVMAWRGAERWWKWQLWMLLGGPAVLVATFVFLILSN